ncbi:hypothetical protein ACEZCY_35815 [Streptacidiphilus sp. N1-12]|uniref:Single-stranded DNA-binding protein n=1 Tax=Streptacidiphilus alkalitolerans TaxID=3342712 RepID=A0ABV6WR72_9ACTN
MATTQQPQPVTLTGFLEDTPRTTYTGAGTLSLAFRLVHSPSDDRTTEAVLPCVYFGVMADATDETIADLFPAGAQIQITGEVAVLDDTVLVFVTHLENLGPEEALPEQVQVLDVRTEGTTTIAQVRVGDSPATWWCVWQQDGTFLASTNSEQWVPSIRALATPPTRRIPRQERVHRTPGTGSRSVEAFKRRRRPRT